MEPLAGRLARGSLKELSGGLESQPFVDNRDCLSSRVDGDTKRAELSCVLRCGVHKCRSDSSTSMLWQHEDGLNVCRHSGCSARSRDTR